MPKRQTAPRNYRNEYTLVVSEDEALALILDEVPLTVKVALISGIKAMHEEPAEAIDSMTRRRKAKP